MTKQKQASAFTLGYREWLFKLLVMSGGRHGPPTRKTEHIYFNRAMANKHVEIDIVESDFIIEHYTVVTDRGRRYIMRNME